MSKIIKPVLSNRITEWCQEALETLVNCDGSFTSVFAIDVANTIDAITINYIKEGVK